MGRPHSIRPRTKRSSLHFILYFLVLTCFALTLRQFQNQRKLLLAFYFDADADEVAPHPRIRPLNQSAPIVEVLAQDFVEEKGSRRYPIVIEEYKLIFFTIQKNGNTVWKQLFRRMIGHKDWRTGMTWGNETGLRTLSNYSLADATKLMNDPSYIRAIFVRDPKERFLSAYLDKAVNTDYFLYYCCHRRRRKKNVTQCHTQSKTMEGFIELTEQQCPNSHWGPLSKRMYPKYLPLINFVGHLETAAKDSKILLQSIGAWDEFGATGWGLHANESIFASKSYVQHKTSNRTEDVNTRLARYFTPKTERLIDIRFEADCAIPQYNLTRRKIDFAAAQVVPPTS